MDFQYHKIVMFAKTSKYALLHFYFVLSYFYLKVCFGFTPCALLVNLRLRLHLVQVAGSAALFASAFCFVPSRGFFIFSADWKMTFKLLKIAQGPIAIFILQGNSSR